MKQGIFVKVNGQEYGYFRVMQTGEYRIVALDQSQLDERFSDLYKTGVFSRPVMPNEIEQKYQYETFALCDGDKLSVRMVENDRVLVGTSDSDVAIKHNLERTDKYFYEGWLCRKQVELITEKHNIGE